MADISKNNKRIAKNTFVLYIRMFVMMAVSFFTSRIVLQVLGETDYGIYNIIGGVVVFFSFLNSALLQATQRFLNYEIGKNDEKAVHDVFCMSMNSYLFLSVLFLLLAETLGLWIVNYYLNIPVNRMEAANWVYQLAIVSFIINLIRVPYNALIIAHERMSFFAYLSLLEVILKLIVVYLLLFITLDKLILFSFFYTLIPLLITIIYKLYCNKSFVISRYQYFWDISLFKRIFSFSSWSLLGNTSNILATQGLNVLVNIFYGVTVNASLGIANQISSKLMLFVSNFQTAFNPQIVKRYAVCEMDDVYKLVFSASKFSYYLMFTISLPLILKMNTILNIWLVEVPEYTTVFSQLILVFMLIEALSGPLWMFVQATGEIKTYQVIVGVLLLVNLPLIWLVLNMGLPIWSVWVVRIFVNIVIFVVRCLFMKSKYNFPLQLYMKKVLLPVFLISSIAIPFPFITSQFLSSEVVSLSVTVFFSLIFSIITIYFFGLNNSEKLFLKSYLEKIRR